MDEALRQAVLYLLRENRAERLTYPMDTTEVDRHIEAVTA